MWVWMMTAQLAIMVMVRLRLFREKMHKLFDGGWITHSVGMLTDYFKANPNTPDVLLLPQVCSSLYCVYLTPMLDIN